MNERHHTTLNRDGERFQEIVRRIRAGGPETTEVVKDELSKLALPGRQPATFPSPAKAGTRSGSSSSQASVRSSTPRRDATSSSRLSTPSASSPRRSTPRSLGGTSATSMSSG